MLNFIAIDLQLYKIFKFKRVSFFGRQCLVGPSCWIYEIGVTAATAVHRMKKTGCTTLV